MRFEQIAIGSKEPEKLMQLLSAVFGLKEWSHDIVMAEGVLFGNPIQNVAELHFNYELGFELEVLRYISGDNWHMRRRAAMKQSPENWLSHIGVHVSKEELAQYRVLLKTAGIGVAQEVETLSHTNPVIAGKRKYRYVIFDSIQQLGFDLKLIERIFE